MTDSQAVRITEVSQSLRDVYRKLASALHPDREPDVQQRRRKTTLMQQANQAHADGNLLALLHCWNCRWRPSSWMGPDATHLVL